MSVQTKLEKKSGILNGKDKILAGIAGAAVLASGSNSYGGIVVVAPPANMPNLAAPGTTTAVLYDLDGNGVNDFTMSFRNPQTASPTTGVIWQANFSPVTAGGTNAIHGFTGPFLQYANALAGGTTIDAASPWRNAAQVTMGSRYRSGGIVSPYGGFANVADTPVRGFLGVRFVRAGQTHFGWIDAEVRPATSAAGSGGIFFFGAAYEDSPGVSIQAGAVPEPTSLALAALGAVGFLGRRRRR